MCLCTAVCLVKYFLRLSIYTDLKILSEIFGFFLDFSLVDPIFGPIECFLMWIGLLSLAINDWRVDVSNEDLKNAEQAEIQEAAVENQAQAEAVEPDNTDEAVSGEQALKAEIEALQQELAETKEQALRTVADAQNVKRRAEKDAENARKYALEKFAGELLVVADNMERAIDSADAEVEGLKPLLEGVELTQKSLLAVFEKFNIEQLSPEGEPFDPQLHQAMSMVPNPDVEPNTVIAVMQKGYNLNGRLVRPAMVMVSKAAE